MYTILRIYSKIFYAIFFLRRRLLLYINHRCIYALEDAFELNAKSSIYDMLLNSNHE